MILAATRRVEEELLVLQPQEEIAYSPKIKENIIILPQKAKEPQALYNYSLMRYTIILCLIFVFGVSTLSFRASYALKISQGISVQSQSIEDLYFENVNLAAKIVEETSLEKLQTRALALGFARYNKDQIYQLSDGFESFSLPLD